MNDREKTIKGLKYCKEYFSCCDKCPYWDSGTNCVADMANDAFILLKEQDNCENCAIAIEDRQPVVRCKDCVYHHYTNDSNHIPYCELIDYGYGWKGDDFCSRGKRRENI